MTSDSSDQLMRVWRGGLSLNAALDLFVAKFDRSELAQIRRSHLQTLEIGKRNFERIGRSDLNKNIQQLSRPMFHLAAAASANISKQIQLIDALEAGDLVALGYPADRPKARVPEPVPLFLMQLQFANFRRSEFSDGEHRYSKVRVVESGALPTTKIGRPSLRDSVLDLASILAKREEITRDTPPKVQVNKIRKLGKFRESALSDQTIKRHLKFFWEAN